MAKGDIVNIKGTDNAILEYQPAAGVEIMVTSANHDSYLGTTGSFSATPYTANLSMKLGIINTLYLAVAANGVGTFATASGVQVK